MVCTRPVVGYRAPNGTVVFAKKHGWVDKSLLIPCGQCQGCRLEKSRQWAMRMMHEASCWPENIFVTLTYRDENLPENHSLCPEHHQLFMKRLRKKYEPRTIRFYHAGEYGGQTCRPHYHDILFNLDFADKKFHTRNALGHALYTSEELDEIWSHGQCLFGDVTFESAAYCARYVMKKLTGLRKSEYGLRVPEYSTMSRRPGLGAPWLEKWVTDVYPNDFCIIDGKKTRVPRFYDGVMKSIEKRLGEWRHDGTYHEDGRPFMVFYPHLEKSPMEKVQAKRIRNAAKHSDNQTRDRLDVIEELTQLRVDRLIRKI